MTDGPGYHNRQPVLAANICRLLYSLSSGRYDKIAPRIEYWIEYAITEQFTTVDDLVERVSSVAWNNPDSHSDISRFLKEFRDASHRSKGAKSFVNDLCLRVLRWFAIASTDNFPGGYDSQGVSDGGGEGFIRAASFVGHLIERGLLSDELVRRHLVKPLTTHYFEENEYDDATYYRTRAIYKLFIIAGNTLLQGLLEPGDVRTCFETFDICTWVKWDTYQYPSPLPEFDKARFDELREIHAAWLRRKQEEEQGNGATTEVPTAEVETPIAFVPQDLPATHTQDVDAAPSPVMQATEPLSMLRGIEYPSETFVNILPTAASSPTLSISTVSDLTPTELSEDIGDDNDVVIHHDTFYFEDGNVEIMCGHTLFRVHSTTVSFSSPKLRDILSQSVLLHAPAPEGRPRIVVTDTAQDFAVLLKMIYTPGFPAWRKVPEFTVFASLLRMATKYGFSNVREQLIDSIKEAYPTKWEDPGTGKVVGESIFGLPIPHPNAVLNMFMEQGVKFALPFAAYRAALGGFSSLTSDKPGTVLPRLALASTMYGMKVIRVGLAEFAHSVVCRMSLRECRDSACAASIGLNPARLRMEAPNKIYGAMVSEGHEGDVLFSRLPENIVCVNCAQTLEQAYHRWCEVIWKELPRIFGVGKSWEEV